MRRNYFLKVRYSSENRGHMNTVMAYMSGRRIYSREVKLIGDTIEEVFLTTNKRTLQEFIGYIKEVFRAEIKYLATTDTINEKGLPCNWREITR